MIGNSLRTVDVKRKSGTTGISDAIVLQFPDLSFITSLQNIVNFCLECAVRFCANGTLNINDDFFLCIEKIEKFYKPRYHEVSQEVQLLFDELLEEAESIRNLLGCFGDNIAQKKDTPLLHILAAKSSQIQWLSVCILEELKKNFSFL